VATIKLNKYAMRKLLQTLWLPLIFLLLPPQLEAQNGWVNYNVPAPGGSVFHFANENIGIITGKYIYHRTSDGGNTWASDSVPYPHSYNDYNAIYFINPNMGWLGMSYEVITFPIGFAGGCTYLTTDGGVTWGPCMSAGPVRDLIFFDSNTGYSATGAAPGIFTEGSIRKTTNGGINWTGIYGGYYFTDITFLNVNTGWGIGFSGSDVGPLIDIMIRTTNGGNNWITLIQDTISGSYTALKHIQFVNENTGYFLNQYLYKSIDGGSNWFLLDTTVLSNQIRSFHFINKDTGWAGGTFSSKILRTTNGGSSWEEQVIPSGTIYGEFQFLNDLTGWVLANGSQLLKTGTGGVTGISNLSSEAPTKFSLHQNYPNPFNPETKIKFEIPLSVKDQKSEVKLYVYDVSGREVQVLLNSELAPGVYEYSFDGAGLGSGVYFYKLQSGDFVQTRRMVLVK
jgi:photosystem II stability/assembly factor-like uncharacterized protein